MFTLLRNNLTGTKVIYSYYKNSITDSSLMFQIGKEIGFSGMGLGKVRKKLYSAACIYIYSSCIEVLLQMIVLLLSLL